MSSKVRGSVYSSSDKNVEIILEDTGNIEDISIGRLVVIEGSSKLYLGVIDSIEQRVYRGLESYIPELSNGKFLNKYIEFLRDEASIKILKVIPVAEVDKNGSEVREVSSSPSIGSKIYGDQVNGIKMFYDSPDYRKSFPVGYAEDITGNHILIPIPLDKLYNLSFGIFGKAGTGKTFLANLLISYTVVYNTFVERDSDRISLLIFDTQGEYSTSLLSDTGEPLCDGACRIFNDMFKLYSLDPSYRSDQGFTSLKIPLYDIDIDDFKTLTQGLNLTKGFLDNLHFLKRKSEEVLDSFSKYTNGIFNRSLWVLPLLYDESDYGWMADILYRNGIIDLGDLDFDGLKSLLLDIYNGFMSKLSEENVSKALLSALNAGRRRLKTLLEYPISFKMEDYEVYSSIASSLLNGDNVVINMGGRYGRNPNIYMAVANLIGRKLMDKVDGLATTSNNMGGRKIAIYLEEAHRFLGKEVSMTNPFGRIAREYRKYGLIVIPIDQRPKELDPDVVAMLWGKFIFNLEDIRDADIATTGLPMKNRFRDLVIRLPRGRLVFYSGLMRYPIVVKALNVCSDKIEGGKSIYGYLSEKMDERRRLDDKTFDEP